MASSCQIGPVRFTLVGERTDGWSWGLALVRIEAGHFVNTAVMDYDDWDDFYRQTTALEQERP